MNAGHLYQLISVFSFGIGNAIWKIPQGQFGVFRLIFYRSAITSMLFFLLCFFNLQFIGEWQDWLTAIFLCAISFWGLVFYNKAIRISTVSQTITVTSASSIFGIATAILVYKEDFEWSLVAALIFVISGLTFLDGQKLIFNFSKGTVYALVAAFFWGTTFALFRIPIEALGKVQFSFCLETTVCLSAFVLMTNNREIKIKNVTKKNKFAVIALALLGFSGVLFYNSAVEHALMSEITFIGTFTPVVSIFVSHLMLKERFGWRQYLGMILAILGGFVLILV